MATVTGVTNHWITAQEGFTTTLASTISSGATTVPLNSVSGYTNGDIVAFVIEPTDASKKQVFTGTIDTAGVQVTGVVWTEGTNQTHNAGVTVVDYWTATHQASAVKGLKVSHDQDGTLKSGAVDVTAVLADAIVTRPKLASTFAQEVKDGWLTGDLPAVSSVTNNGNRSYDITFASTVASLLSPGMRLRTTRTVSAPTQVTALSGTKYWSKVTPNKLTFTNNFVIDVCANPSSYAVGALVTKYNGTSGFQSYLNASGQMVIACFNAGAANSFTLTSYQSVALNKESRLTFQVDMTVTTNTPTTNYMMIDGVDIPCAATRAGTNPTALVQAGNLEIGGSNGGGSPFQGNISQVAIFNAKVTQSTIRSYHGRGYLGTETSLDCAYSFDGNANDLNTTTPNNLSAQNSAGYATGGTFGNKGTSSTLDYALVMAVSGSTATVQVPEGCTIPTSGGVSAVAYSTTQCPFGFILDKDRWEIISLFGTSTTSAALTLDVWTASNLKLSVPVGQWEVSPELDIQFSSGAATIEGFAGLNHSGISGSNQMDPQLGGHIFSQAATTVVIATFKRTKRFNLSAARDFTVTYKFVQGTGTVTAVVIGSAPVTGGRIASYVYAIPAGI